MSIDESSSIEFSSDHFDVGKVTDVIKKDRCTIFKIQTGSKGFHARPTTAFITGLRLLGITSNNAEIIVNKNTGIRCNISFMEIMLAVLTQGITFDLIVRETLDDTRIQDVIDAIRRSNGKY